MDIGTPAGELKLLTAEEAGKILKEVGEHPEGSQLMEDLALEMDDMPEKWFNKILEITGVDY